jgi:hypothetical protein
VFWRTDGFWEGMQIEEFSRRRFIDSYTYIIRSKIIIIIHEKQIFMLRVVVFHRLYSKDSAKDKLISLTK